MNHETPRRPFAHRSRRPEEIGNQARQQYVAEARVSRSVAPSRQGGGDNILEVGGGLELRISPLNGDSIWCEFTFEVAHPQNDMIGLRFVVEAPILVANRLLPGSLVETRLRWREGE